ncbi:hypothetical protein ACFVW1_14530 [Streptomyces olivochromogenes]|uniref:hypothetical protein n=1 Tax=Streptomyces olivochromogenes TaxID=1963 RepID=UPI0036DE101A
MLGFPDLLVLFGIALLVDPWDIVWNTLRPLFLRLTTDSDEPLPASTTATADSSPRGTR